MKKRQTADEGSDGAKRRRSADRRSTTIRRTADLERRLADIEDLANANRRELGLQFLRIAQMQAALESLLKLTGSHIAGSPLPHGPLAALPSLEGRRRP
jgi:hypothetical protein